MPRKSMRRALAQEPVKRFLIEKLMETEALKPWRWIFDVAKNARRERERREFEKYGEYTLAEVARAAGVRTSLIRKYVLRGVRGTGLLPTNQRGFVTIGRLKFFATQHRGRARDIALIAMGRLAAQADPGAALQTHKRLEKRPASTVGPAGPEVKGNPVQVQPEKSGQPQEVNRNAY